VICGSRMRACLLAMISSIPSGPRDDLDLLRVYSGAHVAVAHDTGSARWAVVIAVDGAMGFNAATGAAVGGRTMANFSGRFNSGTIRVGWGVLGRSATNPVTTAVFRVGLGTGRHLDLFRGPRLYAR